MSKPRDRDAGPLLVGEDLEERSARGWIGDLAFAVALAALFALLVVEVAPHLLRGALLDTDSYMRLVRVRQLAATGAWFDSSIPRANAPFGDVLHWTRPVDVLILLGAWVGTPVLGFQRALHWSGVFLSPLLLLATCFAVAWAAEPLTGRRLRYYAMIAVLAQVGIMSYALPGRADHHMLLLLLFVLMTGALFRMYRNRDPAGGGLTVGVLAGVGLWVSPEFLMPVGLLLGSVVVGWILDGGESWRRGFWIGAGLTVTASLALVVERPLGSVLAVEYDRLSVVHLWVCVAAWAFWVVVGWLQARFEGRGPTARLALGTVMGIGLLALTRTLFPLFFQGPMAQVEPVLTELWLPNLTEFQAFLVPDSFSSAGRFVAYLGSVVVGLGFAAWTLVVNRRAVDWPAWVFAAAGMAVFGFLGVRVVRFVPYAEVLGVLAVLMILSAFLAWLDRTLSGFRRTGARVLGSSVLLAGSLLIGGAMMASGGEVGEGAREATATAVSVCSTAALSAHLANPEGWGREPLIVQAHIDLGPELLYLTPHSVLGTPYHRNARGILDGRRIMATRDEDEARGIVDARGVELIVVCESGGAEAWYGGIEPPPTLYRQLIAGEVPVWLRLRDRAGGFLIFGRTD